MCLPGAMHVCIPSTERGRLCTEDDADGGVGARVPKGVVGEGKRKSRTCSSGGWPNGMIQAGGECKIEVKQQLLEESAVSIDDG